MREFVEFSKLPFREGSVGSTADGGGVLVVFLFE